MVGKKLGVLALVLGVFSLGFGGVANATDQEPHKSYVCKYVGEPGPGERLQTGQNPIFVDNHSLNGTGDPVNVGDTFNDAQGRSVVIVANTEKLDPEPSVTDCPLTPPEPEVTTDEEVRMSCEAGVESREVTITTPYVYDYDKNEWVLDTENSETTYGPWEFVRDLTAEERAELNCDQTEVIRTQAYVDFFDPTCKNPEAGILSEYDQTLVKADIQGEVGPGQEVTVVFTPKNENVKITTATVWTHTYSSVPTDCDNPDNPDGPNNGEPNPQPAPPSEPTLPETGAGSLGLMSLIGTALIGLGTLFYRKFAL